jgi:hypothetical protein
MGLFSGIGKLFSGIWNGITKVFKAIMKPVGKLLNSKIGKAIMMGVAIFSMGTSLLAGVQGFAEGTGFIGKFLNGGKAFLNSLLGTNFKTANPKSIAAGGDKGMFGSGGGGGGKAPVIDPEAAGNLLTGTDAGVVGPLAPLGPEGLTPGQMGPPTPAAPPPVAEPKGWLSKAADAGMDFAKSGTGQTVIGNLIQGAGKGMAQREQNKFDSRVQRMFENPNDPGMLRLAQHDYGVNVPKGLAAAPGRFSQSEAQRTGRYTPTIPFRYAPTGG